MQYLGLIIVICFIVFLLFHFGAVVFFKAEDGVGKEITFGAGPILGLISGCICPFLYFWMGVKGYLVANVFSFYIEVLILTFAFITPLLLWFPVSNFWYYPLTLSLPVLFISWLVPWGGYVGIAVSVMTLLSGLLATFVVRRILASKRNNQRALRRMASKQNRRG